MNRSNYRILLDIQSSNGCRLDMKQWDTHRRLYINLTDGGVPYALTERCHPVLLAKTPDGTPCYTACEAENGTVVCDIPSGITASAGLVRCELRLYDTPFPLSPQGEQVELLTSAAFVIRVLPTVYNEGDEIAVASSDEGTALTQLVTQATQALQALHDAKASGEFNGTPATHSWEGTVLTVKSASGTSSADLKGAQGEKGDKGDRGPQGEPGPGTINDDAVGADTWSSKNIVDRLCPSFEAFDSVPCCMPVTDYPLEVETVLPPSDTGHTGVTLTLCGKNLYNGTKYALLSGHLIRHASGTFANSTGFAATEAFIPVSHLRGKTITLQKPPSKTSIISTTAGLAFYRYAKEGSDSYISGTNTAHATVPEDASYMRFTSSKDYIQQAQFELGSEDTGYAAYRGREFTADFGKTVYGGTYNWSSGLLTEDDGTLSYPAATVTVAALPGDNYLFSDTGDTRVRGKADPAVILKKLSDALQSGM